jgi:hypothetical protein
MLLLVTLVGVFCCITSRIMMHMEDHDDQELYITSIPIHVSERGAYPVAAETNRE